MGLPPRFNDDCKKPIKINEIVRVPHPIEEDGRYGLIIGDNPGGDGQIILRVLEGTLISAITLETYDSPAHEDEVILDPEYYEEHMKDQNDHLNKDQIEEAVENADRIFEGELPSGKTMYVWEKAIEEGTTHYVRTEVFEEGGYIPISGNQIRSAYENTPDNIDDLRDTYDLSEIYPNS